MHFFIPMIGYLVLFFSLGWDATGSNMCRLCLRGDHLKDIIGWVPLALTISVVNSGKFSEAAYHTIADEALYIIQDKLEECIETNFGDEEKDIPEVSYA